MRASRLLAIGLVAIWLQTGAQGQDKKPKDVNKLEGSWKFVSYEAPSVPLTPEKVKDMLKKGRVTLTATEMTISMEGEKKVDKVQYRLHKDRPNVMDTFADTVVDYDGKKVNVRQWWPAIFELKDDVLTVCTWDSPVLPEPNEDKLAPPAALEGRRPKEFKASKSTQVMKLKREK